MDNEILEGNKLIARFMGGIFSNTGRTIKIGNTIFEPYTLSYHKSWNSLMPVFLRINETVLNEGGAFLSIDFWGASHCEIEYHFKDNPPIVCVWKAVVDFLKSYTAQTEDVISFANS